MVLDRRAAEDATSEVLELHSIPAPVSKDLLDLLPRNKLVSVATAAVTSSSMQPSSTPEAQPVLLPPPKRDAGHVAGSHDNVAAQAELANAASGSNGHASQVHDEETSSNGMPIGLPGGGMPQAFAKVSRAGLKLSEVRTTHSSPDKGSWRLRALKVEE